MRHDPIAVRILRGTVVGVGLEATAGTKVVVPPSTAAALICARAGELVNPADMAKVVKFNAEEDERLRRAGYRGFP